MNADRAVSADGRSLKIVHVITGLQCGGAETVLARLVTSGARAHFEHVVISLRGEDHYGPQLRSAGIRVYALGLRGLRTLASGMAELTRVIREERPDVVQTWMYHADLLGGLAARRAGVRAIAWGVRNANLDVHAIGAGTRLIAWLGARLSARVPAAIVFNSVEASRLHAAFGYRTSRFRIIANGYDVRRFRPDDALRSATRVHFNVDPVDCLLGTVARWDAQKDHATLLAAFRLVAERRADLRLLLIGPGMTAQNRELAELIRLAGVDERVILGGASSDVAAVMNAIDVHVLSSLGEAFPNVVAEAMACGTPCVVTDVGDAARIVGEPRWVAPPRDAAGLANAIERALRDIRELGRAPLAARCRERIVENFAMERMTSSYAALWQELGSLPAGRRATA